MKLRKLLIKTGILTALLALMLAFAPVALASSGSLALTSAPGSSQEGSGAGSTTTTGAEEGESEEDLERRKEVYTMGALITLGAIIVGIRNKKRR